MERSRPRALSNQLVFLLAVFSLGPLFLSNMWGYLTTRNLITENAIRNLRNVGELEASRTFDFVENQRSFLDTTVADNQHLFSMLRALQVGGDPQLSRDVEQALQKHLTAKVVQNRAAQELFVLSPTGVLLGSSKTGEAVGTMMASNPCFRAGETGADVATVEFHGSEPDLLLGSAIHDRSQNYLGVLCGRFGFDIHDELVAAHSQRTPNGALYLLDGSGHVICGSFQRSTGQRVKPDLPPALGRPQLGSTPWTGRYALEGGVENVAAYTPIPKLGWSILVEVPLSHVTGVLDHLKWRGILLGIVLVIVIAVAAYRAGHSIVRPLGQLVDAARRASSGVLGQLVPASGPAEVADLVVTFNRMSTALKVSQDALKHRVAERTVFAELLLNSIDEPVLVVDRSLHIISANRAALRAHGEEILGTSYGAVPEVPNAESPLRQVFETARPAAVDRALKLAGSSQIVHLEVFPVFDASDRVESVVCIERVVTAERRLLAQTMHHEKMAAFGLLAAGMAHEIGNPLASIEWQLRRASETDDPRRIQPTLAAVKREVRRISELLRDLVSFTRRQRDAEVIVGPNQVVRDVARLLGHDPRAKNSQIDLRLAENVPYVRAKEDHLLQILLNLGINGLDAMEEGGTLTFETTCERGMAVVRVRDTGCGLPENVASRIFEPFFTTKPPGRGTGLGLFVSRGIVERLGGQIVLEGSAPGDTTFAIRIPSGSASAEVQHERTGTCG